MPTLQHIEGAKKVIIEMLDDLPIIATIIGTRSDEHEAGPSSPEELELMNALFAVHAVWLERKPSE